MLANIHLIRLQSFYRANWIKLAAAFGVVFLHFIIFWFIQLPPSQGYLPMPMVLQLNVDLQFPQSFGGDKVVNKHESPKIQKTKLQPTNTSSLSGGLDKGQVKAVISGVEPGTKSKIPLRTTDDTSNAQNESNQSLLSTNANRDQNTLSSAVEIPSLRADYLNNPKPRYPTASLRLEEQGKVIVRVFISSEGVPQQVVLGLSSGFTRLDQAALEAVKDWRFVPGKRAGVFESMWLDVPVVFKIN